MCWCKVEDFPCLAGTGISLAATVYTFEKQFHCVMSSGVPWPYGTVSGRSC